MPKKAAQTANAAPTDGHDTTDITSSDIPLHRPILTTQSILDSFLVDNITLDETLTEGELTKALKAAGVEKKKLKWVRPRYASTQANFVLIVGNGSHVYSRI